MKYSHLALLLATTALVLPAPANELPPSDVTPHDLLSPREHAELYLNLITRICQELIPLQDSVTDEASAAAAAPKIEALHNRLNLAVSHLKNNPDMSREVSRILADSPERATSHRKLGASFLNSLMRCRKTGLITSREFNRMPIGNGQ